MMTLSMVLCRIRDKDLFVAAPRDWDRLPTKTIVITVTVASQRFSFSDKLKLNAPSVFE